MKKLVLALTALVSTASFAHFKIGTYKGVDESGKECAIELKSVAFIEGHKHPLAERVEAVVGGEAWTLSHFPLIDKANLKVVPEGEVLSGVKGLRTADFTGARAVVFTMDESPQVNGPVDFVVMEHNYLDESKSTKTTCSKLVFTK